MINRYMHQANLKPMQPRKAAGKKEMSIAAISEEEILSGTAHFFYL